MICNRFGLTAILVTAYCLAAPASAAPLSVSESTDFPGVNADFTPAFDAGDLDVGLNTVSGNIFETDIDVVLVTLPAGLVIDTIDVIITNHADGTTSPTSLRARLLTPASGTFEQNTPGDGTLNLLAGPVTTPGDFALNVSHNGGIPNSSSDWEWQIAVVVPEPTSLALLSLGGLALLTRRQRCG